MDVLGGVERGRVGFAPRGGAPILDESGEEIARLEGAAFIGRDQCVMDADGRVRIAAGGRGDGWVFASELEFCPRHPESDALEQELRRKGIVERLSLSSSGDGTMEFSWSDSPWSEYTTRYRCEDSSPLPIEE